MYAHASLQLSPGHALKVRYLPLCYIAGPSELYPDQLVPVTVLGCTCSLLSNVHLPTTSKQNVSYRKASRKGVCSCSAPATSVSLDHGNGIRAKFTCGTRRELILQIFT